MDVWSLVWSTLLLVVVLLVFGVIIWYMRSIYSDSSMDEYSVNMEKMVHHIRNAKAKETKAWDNALSYLPDESIGLTSFQTRLSYKDTALNPVSDFAATTTPSPKVPPTAMQQAFFSFWKIPLDKRPITAKDANMFIENDKSNLKAEGFAHRVRRWNRLELVMGRFCSEFDVPKLNLTGFRAGINKPILDVLLETSIQLLSKKQLNWKELTHENSYNTILQQIGSDYPRLNLMDYKQ